MPKQMTPLESLNQLHDFFWPRRTWASPSVTCRPAVREAVTLLQQLLDSEAATFWLESIPRCRLHRSAWLLRPEYLRTMDAQGLRACQSNRGQPSLHEQRWSAYRELRRLHPGETLVFTSQPPFGFMALPSRAVCTAGNVDAERALRFVADCKVTSLAMVGDWHPSWLPDPDLGQRLCCQATLAFKPEALALVQAHFERKDAALRAAIREFNRLG